MNKKYFKLAVSTIAVILLISLATVSLCTGVSDTDFSVSKVDDGQMQTSPKLSTGVNQIIRVFQVVGAAVGIIILLWLGMKYMSAAPSEKADIKKGAIIYIIGAVVLFAAPNVVALIFDMTKNIHA